jgi:hypothetical protein
MYYPEYGYAFDEPLYANVYPETYNRYFSDYYDGSDASTATALGVGVAVDRSPKDVPLQDPDDVDISAIIQDMNSGKDDVDFDCPAAQEAAETIA